MENVIRHGSGIFELQLARQDMTFVPGDCVALYGADGKVSRPYSLASGVDEPFLRFVIRRMEGGEVSPFLASRKPGDEVMMSPPFGWFRPAQAPAVFIATGTGIAPFLSYFRSQAGRQPVLCLYGVRAWEDAVEVDWLRSVCDLRMAVSREAVPGCHHGRVTGLLDRVPVDGQHHYYLCGLDAMIDEITVWLESRGVEITRIHRECFFNASYASE